jgi:hypothetical protein
MVRTVRFDAVIEPMTWGRNTYTVIYIPPELVDEAARWPTRRIEGIVDGLSLNLGLNKANSGVTTASFIYVGASLQRRLQVKPGDVVACEFAPADPDRVPLPDDVAGALDTAGCMPAWECIRPSERRQLLAPIENAARAHTRRHRIEQLVRSLTSSV